MNPARLAFYAGVAVVTAFFVVLINNLPTIFDIITICAGTIGGVVVGRKSTEWF